MTEPINIYLHKQKKNFLWASNYEIAKSFWASDKNYLSGWTTSQFTDILSNLPNAETYFSLREYSKEEADNSPGFYLIHYGTSRTLNEHAGLACLSPEIRDQINAGKLNLLIVFVLESFDSFFSMSFWAELFYQKLTAIGVSRHKSVTIIHSTYDDTVNYSQDSRVSWVYYPFFEAVLRKHYNAIYESPNRRLMHSRKYRFLCLTRNPRPNRLLLNACIEFKKLNHYGYLSWPKSHNRFYYDKIFGPGSPFKDIKQYPDFEKFMISQKKLEGYYRNCDSITSGATDHQYDGAAALCDLADFEIVNETHQDLNGSGVFLTEKTFRSLFAGIPFMLFGNYGSLELLHTLGYRTFPMIFNEDYDTERSITTKILSIVNEIEKLCNSKHPHNLFNSPEVRAVIEHNQQLFWNKDHSAAIYHKLIDTNAQ